MPASNLRSSLNVIKSDNICFSKLVDHKLLYQKVTIAILIYIIIILSFLGCTMAVPTAYGGFQIRGRIRAVATGLCHSHSNARSELHLRPTAHSYAGSLTHWWRPGIEPASSGILARFISTEPQMELLNLLLLLSFISINFKWDLRSATETDRIRNWH